MTTKAMNQLLQVLSRALTDSVESRNRLHVLEAAMRTSQPQLYSEYVRRLEIHSQTDATRQEISDVIAHLQELLQKQEFLQKKE
jgi:hypothetical protein